MTRRANRRVPLRAARPTPVVAIAPKEAKSPRDATGDAPVPDSLAASASSEATGLALAVARQFYEMDAADRWAMIDAVRGRLLGASPERPVLCRMALNACLQDVGRLSKNGYEDWRAAQTCPYEWPSSKYIRITFGSWGRAMASVGHVALADVLASELSPTSAPFTREVAIENVREFAQTTSSRSLSSYREWARDRMADPARRQSRYVRSDRTFVRLFGSWQAALVAAQVIDDAAQSPRSGASSAYSKDVLIANVRAAAESEDTTLTKKRYDGWAQDYVRTHPGTTVARSGSVANRFGSWHKALHAAGLIDDAELAQRAGRRTTFIPDAALLRALRTASRDVDGPITSTSYERFRRSVWRESNVLLPSVALLKSRFGSWSAAVARSQETAGQL